MWLIRRVRAIRGAYEVRINEFKHASNPACPGRTAQGAANPGYFRAFVQDAIITSAWRGQTRYAQLPTPPTKLPYLSLRRARSPMS